MTIWKIAVGVCLGSLVASAICWGVAELHMRWVFQQTVATLSDQAAKAQKSLTDAQRDSALKAIREAESQARLEQRQRDELARQHQEAARREAAWKRFYSRSPGCVASNVSVECANEHIRAKKEFEAKYSAGKL